MLTGQARVQHRSSQLVEWPRKGTKSRLMRNFDVFAASLSLYVKEYIFHSWRNAVVAFQLVCSQVTWRRVGAE